MAKPVVGCASTILAAVLTATVGAGGTAETSGFVNEAQLLADTDARIQRTRTAPLHIEVTDGQGQPAASQVVNVEHVRHLFHFGAGFDARIMERPDETEVDRRHREQFLRLFNYATVHLYWGGYERQAGQPEGARRAEYARWLKAKGLVPRGHPVFWNQDNTLPRWLRERNPAPAEMRQLMDARLREMSGSVLPELRDVDVFNELVHWERFTNNPMSRLLLEQGKVAVVAEYLKEARRLNAGVQLVVNDYDTTPAFNTLLGRLLAAGAPIDIIGQQSHMHNGPWSVKQIWECLERHAQLKRPVLFSELSVLSGPRRQNLDYLGRQEGWETDPEHELRQADYLEQFYRLLYSHANCLGVVVWNYTDRGAWLGAPVGLLRKDGSPKPSYERLDRLINQRWRTRGEFTTDAAGRVTVPGAYEGHYRITAGTGEATGDHRVAHPLRVQVRR
jgi:GH35 family endo-1,4-beta-xylanase